jgi:iron complex outermembrane receptor protein
MSELIQKNDNRATIRWKLLTSASALALTISSIGVARAENTDRPLIWIELGGQLEQVGGQGDPFTPGFIAANPTSPVFSPISPLQAQKPAPFSFAEDGKISFQPEGSSWVFSASINYGRSNDFKHVDQQTHGVHAKYYSGVRNTTNFVYTQENFAETKVQHRGSHDILDFSAGKDVGLGMFGSSGSSTLSLGVRFAQFVSTTTFDARAVPDLHAKYITGGNLKIPRVYFHSYHATGKASRSFRGVGPSLSWNGTAPLAGNPQNGEITFDWGASAAILFGKQKARVRHQESAHYGSNLYEIVRGGYYGVVYQNPPRGHDTNRSVIVPNAGGFAGASYRIENTKVSVGYRADVFFGAMDVGIDARKNQNRAFYGPFLSVSIGIGD